MNSFFFFKIHFCSNLHASTNSESQQEDPIGKLGNEDNKNEKKEKSMILDQSACIILAFFFFF